MRHQTLLVAVFVGCTASDDGIKTYNDNPEATITSHADGAVLSEGSQTLFRAQVSDSNHDTEELEAAWYVDNALACDWAAPSAAGETQCNIAPVLGASSLVVEVRDPEGAGGRDEITFSVQPSNPPIGMILSPLANAPYFADQLISFSAIVSDAEDLPTALTATWESSLNGPINVGAQIQSSGEFDGAAYLSPGEHFLQLHVDDTSGKRTTESVIIWVNDSNIAPSCAIVEPATGGAVLQGETVAFRGTATDPDSNGNPMVGGWSSNIDGYLGPAVIDINGEILFSSATLSENPHIISLTVTDYGGAACTDAISLDVLGNAPPEITSLSLTPTPAYTNDTLTATATATDAEGDPISLNYAWSVDGITVQSGPDSSLDGINHFDKNQTVSLSVTPNDGNSDGAPMLTQLSISNTAPSSPGLVFQDAFGIEIVEGIEGIDEIRCVVLSPSSDDDGDAISVTIDWMVNGTAWTGATSSATLANDTIPMTELIAGQTWTCTATPNDGQDDGPSTSIDILIVPQTPPTVTLDTLNYNGMTYYPLDLDDCLPYTSNPIMCCNPITSQEQMDAFCQLAGYSTAVNWVVQTITSTNCYCWACYGAGSWHSNCCSGQDDRNFITSVDCQ